MSEVIIDKSLSIQVSLPDKMSPDQFEYQIRRLIKLSNAMSEQKLRSVFGAEITPSGGKANAEIMTRTKTGRNRWTEDGARVFLREYESSSTTEQKNALAMKYGIKPKSIYNTISGLKKKFNL